MSGAGGVDRIGPRKACGQIGGGKTVARGGGVDDRIGQGFRPHLAR